MRETQGVGSDDAHAVGVHVAQALPEALQAGERPRGDVLVDAAVLGDTGGEAHHLAQAVDDDQLAMGVARHDHVEAVGPKVHGGKDVWHGPWGAAGGGSAFWGSRGGGDLRHARPGDQEAVNEDPQPQVVTAFGLRMTNCAPSSPSR